MSRRVRPAGEQPFQTGMETVIGVNVMEFMETHRSSCREVRKKSREKSQGEESEEMEKS